MMCHQLFQSIRNNFFIIFLFMLALTARTYTAFHGPFIGDEADSWQKAVQITTGEHFPKLGPELTGGETRTPGPLFYYVMALPNLFSIHPLWSNLFIALLHTLAGFLIYLMVLHYSEKKTALIYAVLFCFAPWDLLYSDRIWSANLAPVWSMFALYCAAKWNDSPMYPGATLFFALTLPQIHLSAPIIWLIIIILVIGGTRRDYNWKSLAVGLIAAGITYTPMVYHEIQNNFSNYKYFIKESQQNKAKKLKESPLFDTTLHAVFFTSGETGYFYRRGEWYGFNEKNYYFSAEGHAAITTLYSKPMLVAGFLSLLLSLASWLYAFLLTATRIWHRIQKRNSQTNSHLIAFGLIVAVFTCGILLTTNNKSFYPHYLNMIMPLALIIPACFLSAMFNLRLFRTNIIAGILLVATVFFMAHNSWRIVTEYKALNSVTHTFEMVRMAAQEQGKINLVFTDYRNRFAWTRLSECYFGKRLDLNEKEATVTYTINNSIHKKGETPDPSYTWFGPIGLKRTEKTP